ncbi:MAG: hypothetical protein K5678_10690 [Acetatifactor sp.]|nr:hypothetical protein [Acetatifactor sp.]
MKHFITFSKLELLNLYGLNVLRHVKDPAEKKKKTAIFVVIALTVLLLAGYLCGSAYAMTLFGVGDWIPALYSLFACLLILVFNAFKAKSFLYRDKDLALLSSLPVKSLPIVAARLLHFYVESAIIGAAVILPTFLIYFVFERPGVSFLANLLLALLLLPILPTAISAWLGILVCALVARNRHKVLTETIFMLVVVIGALLLPPLFAGGKMTSQSEPMNLFAKTAENEVILRELGAQARQTFDGLERSMPLLTTWRSLFQAGKVLGLMVYGASSLLFMALTALVIGRNFFSISAKLFPQTEHHEYHMHELQSKSLLTALVQKEARRYFSCGIYVTNTIVGPILIVLFAITLGFVDLQTLLSSNGVALPMEFHVDAALPFILGLMFCIMNPSSSSISMEGPNWWILKSLPVCFEDMVNAKLLFNLLLMAPFYVLAEIILLFTVQTSLLGRLWLFLIPAGALLFSVTFGLLMNLKFPKFEWQSATEVVKQSAAAGLSMLALPIALIGMIVLLIAPAHLTNLITLGFLFVLGVGTLLIYRKLISSLAP